MTTHTEKLIQDGLWRDISEAPECEIEMLTPLGVARGHAYDFHETMRMPKELWATHFRMCDDEGRLANALKVAVNAVYVAMSDDVPLDRVAFYREALAEIERIAKGEK